MGQFSVLVPANLSKVLFGIWIVGMGVAHGFGLVSTPFGVLLGIVLVAAGVCSLFGK